VQILICSLLLSVEINRTD